MNDYTPIPDWTPEGDPSPSLELRRERMQASSIAIAILFISLATLLFQILFSALIFLVAPQLTEKPWYMMVISMLPMHLIAMPLSLVFYRLGKASPPTKRSLSFPAWLALLCITFAITYIGNFIGIAVNAIISLITGEPVENQLDVLTQQTPLWANLVFVGILAPILEEIFYRKLVIDRLRRYGDLVAILVSGALFGLLHGNFSQFFYAFLGGVLFGYVYLYTGKLRYTIALHMTVNLVGGVFISELAKHIDEEALASGSIDAILQNLLPLSLFGTYLLFIIACLILGPILLILFRRHIRFEKGEIQLTPKSFFRIFFLNPPVWILLLFIIFTFIL